VVENFELISDAIESRVNGYIEGYDVVNEKTESDGLVNITVKARVTMSALKADAQYLARAVGGIRFMVVYDAREQSKDERASFDFAVERINQFLSAKKYRYIEKARFEQIRNEALNIMQEDDTNDLSFVQQLGIKSGAQFIIMLKDIHRETRESGAFGTKQEERLVIEIKAYDNCTAEGLGTVVLDGPWHNVTENALNMRQAIQEAINAEYSTIMTNHNAFGVQNALYKRMPNR
jgi:hypothetical protein